MAYQSGQVITANTNPDFNTMANDINEIYTDLHPGETIELPGNFGYGKSPAIPPVAPNQIVTAAQWTALFDTMVICATHQGTSLGVVPDSVNSGELVDAFDGASGTLAVIGNLITNRHAVNVGQFTNSTNGSLDTSTRVTSWSSQIVHEVQVNFGSYDQMRYFFNTGGQIRIAGERTGGTGGANNTNWTNILDEIGTVKFTRIQCVGDSGNSTINGFWRMTDSFQSCFTKSAPGYSGDNYEIRARVDGGPFGSSGLLRFQIRFNTSGTVDGTLNSFIDEKRATGVVPIPSPSVTTITEVSVGG